MAQQTAQRSKKNHALSSAARPVVAPQRQPAHRARELLAAFILLAVASALMAYIQFNPNNPYLAEIDSYYHVKMAELLQERGVLYTFPWLQFTILRDSYVDHHLLFHILLIPFINLFGSILGAKLFQVLVVGLIFVVFHRVLENLGVKGAFGLAFFALFTMSADFYFRMSFIRDMGLSLLFMMIGIYLITKPAEAAAANSNDSFLRTAIDPKRSIVLLLVCIFFATTHLPALIPWAVGIYLAGCWVNHVWERRSAAIFLLCALYVWAYGGFMFLPIFAIIFFVAQILTGEKPQRRVPLAALAGAAAGLVLNPYFPKNLAFLYHQIFNTGLGAEQYAGGEWQSYDTWQWLQSNAVPIAVFFCGIALALVKRIEQSAKSVSVFVFSLFFVALVWKSKRFVEYSSFFMPLAGLGLIGPFLGNKAEEWRRSAFFKRADNIFYGGAAAAFLCVSFLFAFVPSRGENLFLGQIEKSLRDVQTLFSMSALNNVHGYLRENSAPGDIVFTDDWDVFPRYFFANSKNYYIVGLDPEFMNQYAGEPFNQPGWLFVEFAQISSGAAADHLERIKTHFKAKWVLVNSSHGQFYENLKRQPELFQEVVFAANDPDIDGYRAAQDDGYHLFKVR
jgi:hypothetical protein